MKQTILLKINMTKNSVLLVLFTIMIFSSVIYLYADTGVDDKHGKPVDVIIQKIREKQGLGPDEKIDPRNVSNIVLEELGEAVMSALHPDSGQHELMDNMMGGEGSKSLSSMHRRMGYSYIRGDSGGMMGGSFMPMMGGSMMGNRFGYFSYGWIIILLAALIIFGIILYLVIRSRKSLGKAGGTHHGPPLIIAQRRYALGQITKEKYETIKRDLK